MKKLLALLVFFSLTYNAQAASSSAPGEVEVVKNFVKNIGDDIIKIASNPKLTEKKKRNDIISKIDQVVDSSWISRFVLGKNYRRFSKEQKIQFKDLYRQFMINTYGPKFKDYNGRKFSVLKVDKQRIFYVARCEFLPMDSNVTISVDFRVKKRKGKLVILDFVAEGVSLIESQRSEYDSAISQNGIAKFLQDFQDKVTNLKSSQD